MEFVTIYFNECDQIGAQPFKLVRNRLAQVIPGLKQQRAYYDINPTGIGPIVPASASTSRADAVKLVGNELRRIEMNFLPDVYVMCEVCRGKRYHSETLAVRYKGHSISDILNLPSSDALKLLENIPQIQQKLSTLVEVGLGYVTLGQSATTLSGGEAQPIKLARELSKRQTGRTLYILDEPTTGLHFDDVRKMQSGGFIENVKIRPLYLRAEFDALSLAAGKSCGGLAERDVAEAQREWRLPESAECFQAASTRRKEQFRISLMEWFLSRTQARFPNYSACRGTLRTSHTRREGNSFSIRRSPVT